ncbi:hypothetical protein IT408_00855 [Candidatus Uhrbacteria bacterium]|nr:hypothetical protein [Candidatus Uhrbacteria bacterium]
MSDRKVNIGICALLLVLRAVPVVAVDQTSANFQNFNSSFISTTVKQQSNNFQIIGGVESIVGNVLSNNFGVAHGVPSPQAAPSIPPVIIPSSGGGGGGGGGSGTTTTAEPNNSTSTVPLPTVEYRAWTFKNKGVVHGTRTTQTDQIWVNGSADGVTLIEPVLWEKVLPLFLGMNEVRVQQVRGSDRSNIVIGYPKRRLIGDADDNRFVEDIDISLLTRAWKIYSVDADFNEDGRIDDVDLSLLVAHWGQSY